MPVGKSMADRFELGLNTFGVEEQLVHKGYIEPLEPKGDHFLCNFGGHIRPNTKKEGLQSGWRIYVEKRGSAGGFLVTRELKDELEIMPGEGPFEHFYSGSGFIRVEHIGMVSNDWGALVISRVF